MATIDSLDLASLQNNPTNIAEALEDVLETTSGNIGTLKSQAEDLKDDIDDIKTASQAVKDDLDDMLSSVSSAEHHHFTSYDDSWGTWALTTTTDDETGCHVWRWGKIYIVSLIATKNTGIQAGDSVILTSSTTSGCFTYPENDLHLGVSYFGDGSNSDFACSLHLGSDGALTLHFKNDTGNYYQVIGNFMAVDV